MAKPRLHVECPLDTGEIIELRDNAFHYLSRVMRLGVGDVVEVFNGASDAYDAVIETMDKRSLELRVTEVSTPFRPAPNVWLAFAPIKKDRTDFIVEKATELGVAEINPVSTEYTNSERIRVDRLQRHAVEAAEQCGGTFIPPVRELQKLGTFLGDLGERKILFCDESAPAGTGENEFNTARHDEWVIVIGPEGGFSPRERDDLLERGALRLSLGPRILRAETAAVSAITLWQNTHGDWSC